MLILSRPVRILVLFLLIFFWVPCSFQGSRELKRITANCQALAQETEEEEPFATELQRVRDPFEPVNRAMFTFNDRLYFWVIKPTATLYKKALPQGLRVGIRNMFHNFKAPIRIVNNLLQGKLKGCFIEVSRLVINSTLGIGGFFDPANDEFHIREHSEDFGQTLGVWGFKPCIYFVWPILGPSTLRDSVGIAGDLFLDPVFYLPVNLYTSAAIKGADKLNDASLRLGEYENFKTSALDPYVALRNAYIQYRQKEIRK